MNRQVAITGLGFVTSIGGDRAEVVRSLRELRHGFGRWEPLGPGRHPVSVAGLIRGETGAAHDQGRLSATENGRHGPPHVVHASRAVRQALEEAGLVTEDLRDGGTGLYCASSGSSMSSYQNLLKLESTSYRRGNPLCVLNSIAGTLNFHLSAQFGIRGAGCGFVSACASGSHALGFAFDEIALGRQQRMIVVAAEDLTAETLLPFHVMAALSTNPDPESASRPFDVARDGFVGTGGAVAIVLENAEVARARGARIQAWMSGWGQACDGHHPAQPHPEGAGLQEAMRRALRASRVDAADVGYINAHATSTPAGDRAEAKAIHALFGAAGARPAVSSTKALTGHGLSLAGGMEAAFCVLALDEGFTPGQAHLREPDEDALRLHLPRTSLPVNPRIALNNSSGFGGANVCHVFTAASP